MTKMLQCCLLISPKSSWRTRLVNVKLTGEHLCAILLYLSHFLVYITHIFAHVRAYSSMSFYNPDNTKSKIGTYKTS